MHNIIFEEVDGEKSPFCELPVNIKNKLNTQACCREWCNGDLLSHSKYRNLNYIVCDNGEVRFWCLKHRDNQKEYLRRLDWLARRAEKLRQIIEETNQKKINLVKFKEKKKEYPNQTKNGIGTPTIQ